MNLNKLLWASTAIVALASCQTASDPYMTLETKSLSLEVDGGTATVKLFTNVYYRVNNDCFDDAGNYWARITDTEVDGDATTFHIKYDANEKSAVRTGTVRFIGDGVTPLKLTLNQKAVAPKGINPNFVELPFTENTTTFTVLDEREWTAECEDKGVVISPASGKGVTNVTVTLPENSTISGRKVNVNVAIKGDQTYAFAIDQKKYVGILADWAFKESLSETQKTFADSEEQSVFPGTNGKYVAASTGDGKLEYYAVERTGYSVAAGKSKAVCKRGVGAKGGGDPYISGTIPGDYWLVTATMGGKVIPAGTKIKFRFITKMGTACSTRWMTEYKSGEEWLPTAPVQEFAETAVKALSGQDVEYSAVVKYNFAATFLDPSNNGAYIPVEGTFTTAADMTTFAFRFREAGHLGLDGAKFQGLYIDQTHTSGQSRFSGQTPNNPETGEQVKEYDEHATFTIEE